MDQRRREALVEDLEESQQMFMNVDQVFRVDWPDVKTADLAYQVVQAIDRVLERVKAGMNDVVD